MMKIKLLVKENPRRPGTHAHRHFEVMQKYPSLERYLAQFPERERPVARRWLYNTIRDGYAKITGK